MQVKDIGCNPSSCCYRFPSKWKLEGKVNGRWKMLDYVEKSGFTSASTNAILTRRVYTEHYVTEVKFTFLGPQVNFVNCGKEENSMTIYKLDFFGFFSTSSYHPTPKSCRKFSLIPYIIGLFIHSLV